jgi:hypothetical protein
LPVKSGSANKTRENNPALIKSLMMFINKFDNNLIQFNTLTVRNSREVFSLANVCCHVPILHTIIISWTKMV